MTNQGLILAAKIVATIWLIVISVWDRLHRRVPNILVLPVMCGAFLWQVYEAIARKTADRILFVIVVWAVLGMLWRVHIFGGGDSKLLMALFALFPTTQFLILFCLVVLIASIPVLVAKYAKRGLRASLRSAGQRLAHGPMLPSAEELETQGSPHCWSLVLPGVIYLWLAF